MMRVLDSENAKTKILLKNLLLIVSWIGPVDPFTNIADNSSYVFKKSIGNLKFR